MSTATVILVPAVLLLLAVLYLIIAINPKSKKTSSRLPPGYVGWRHIGEVFHLLKPTPPNTVGEFLSHRMSRFGKVFTTNLVGQPVIASADPELNRFLLQNESRLLEHAWLGTQIEMMGKTNIALQVGDAYKQLRAITVGFLSAARLRTSFLEDAEEVAASIIGSWKECSVVSTSDAAKQFVFSFMVKNVLGMAPGEPEIEKLMLSYENFFLAHLIVPIKLPGTKYWRSMEARKYILKVIDRLIDERKKKEKGGGSKAMEDDDLLGWVVENTNLSREQIGDHLLGMIFAGKDSPANALTLMVYFLGGCPEAIEQLREEHMHAVKSKKEGNLTWDDYKQLEFTNCVINETLRLGNVARFLMKKASTDIQFKGYEIPRGCKLFLFFSSSHLDASNFEDPERFNPWRWLTSSGLLKTNNFMPFSRGPRECPGAELARLQMTVFLHHLILSFDWKLTEDDRPMALPGVTFPKGLPIKIQSVTRSHGCHDVNP